MKKQLFILLTFCLTLAAARAGNANLTYTKMCAKPRIRSRDILLYINPAPRC